MAGYLIFSKKRMGYIPEWLFEYFSRTTVMNPKNLHKNHGVCSSF
jgi:hypothetical protein